MKQGIAWLDKPSSKLSPLRIIQTLRATNFLIVLIDMMETSLKILLVDDSENSCIAIGRLLEKAGHRIRMAFNAESALGVAQDFDADVVMLDFKMPDINGYELLRRLKKITTLQNAKFFAVSGYRREDIQEKASEVDFDYFIMKPIDVSDLQKLFLNKFRLIQSGLP